MNTIKKKQFFKTYLNSLSIPAENKKKLLTTLTNNNNNDVVEIKSNNLIKLTINLELHLLAKMFTLNFRNNLINYIKNKYDSRAYYLFFIESINYENILKYELPLIKKVGEYYILNLPVDVELVYYKKNDIAEMYLMFFINTTENKIQVFAKNKYLLCNINTNNQVIEKTNSNAAILRDQKSQKIFKNNNIVSVKITEFYNNQLEEGFTSKINCGGEIVIL